MPSGEALCGCRRRATGCRAGACAFSPAVDDGRRRGRSVHAARELHEIGQFGVGFSDSTAWVGAGVAEALQHQDQRRTEAGQLLISSRGHRPGVSWLPTVVSSGSTAGGRAHAAQAAAWPTIFWARVKPLPVQPAADGRMEQLPRARPSWVAPCRE